MPLNGTNKKCEQCRRSCKQWSQVEVIYCPKFENKSGKTRDFNRGDPSCIAKRHKGLFKAQNRTIIAPIKDKGSTEASQYAKMRDLAYLKRGRLIKACLFSSKPNESHNLLI